MKIVGNLQKNGFLKNLKKENIGGNYDKENKEHYGGKKVVPRINGFPKKGNIPGKKVVLKEENVRIKKDNIVSIFRKDISQNSCDYLK